MLSREAEVAKRFKEKMDKITNTPEREEPEVCSECGSAGMVYVNTYADDDEEWVCKYCGSSTHE